MVEVVVPDLGDFADVPVAELLVAAGDVVEAGALLVEELLDEGVRSGGRNDLELDFGATDLGDGAAEIGVGAGLPRVEELETEQAFQLFSLRLPARRGHADVVDAFDGKQRGLRGRM